ncbi:MAG: S9 family peptidase, partial [Candidatus Zixiibacteriota bacterium]
MPQRLRLKTLLLTLLATALAVSCIQQRVPDPPTAAVQPKTNSLHGISWTDDYYWLREREDPEVIRYLGAENEYTEAVMKHTRRLQEKLYNEYVSRIKQTDRSVPEKKGNYYYYERFEEGKQYSIKCRKKGSLDSPEEIMLDENLLAEGHGYFYVARWDVSTDENLLAYSVDTSGSELYTIYVKDLTTGELLPDRIADVYASFAWANDSRTLMYIAQDDARRPYKLFRHRLGSEASDDKLLYHEKDEAFELYLSKSKSKKYIFMRLESATTSEIHFLDADQPDGTFRVIEPRRHMMEYSVYHQGDNFYIRTNDNALNFKLMVAPVARPGRQNWKEYIAHSDSVKIDGVDAFKDYLVVYERRGGLKRIKVIDVHSQEAHYIEFPETVWTYWPWGNPEFDSGLLRFMYTSLITPRTIYDYDMSARTSEVKKEQEIPCGYDKQQFVTERIFATA